MGLTGASEGTVNFSPDTTQTDDRGKAAYQTINTMLDNSSHSKLEWEIGSRHYHCPLCIKEAFSLLNANLATIGSRSLREKKHFTRRSTHVPVSDSFTAMVPVAGTDGGIAT